MKSSMASYNLTKVRAAVHMGACQFVCRFTLLSACSEKTPLRYNFSRHSIRNAIRTIKLSCECYFTVSRLNCWHKNARTLEFLKSGLGFCSHNMSVFAKLSRTLGCLQFPSLRSPYMQTDLWVPPKFRNKLSGFAKPALWISRFGRGHRTTSAMTSFTAYVI